MTPIPLWVYLGIVACSGISCALSVPFWRRWCVRIGLIDEPGGRKDHSQITPLAGGLAVFSGLAISVLIGVLGIELGWISPEMLERFRYGLAKRAIPLSAILFGALGILILGLVDDRFELSPKFKFLGQFTVATLIAVAGIRITLFVPSAVFSYVVTVFWIVTLMNSVNFLDNMNGLTGGLAVIASAGFAIIAIQHQQYLVAMMGCMIVGSFLGFLPFNFPRASIFLGDAGSHLAGFLVAVLAILPHFFNVKRSR